MFYPKLTQPQQSRDMLQEFRGYNHNLRCAEGEFYDMTNLTGQYYPVLSPRNPRGVMERQEEYQGMLAKDSLAVVRDGVLYYAGNEVEGIHLTRGDRKRMYSMGAYLLIWPDKVYYNTADPTDYGYMERENSFSGDVGLTICKQDGEAYGATMIGNEPPTDPDNGQLWIDTSGEKHGLKVWNETSSMWVSVATTYVKITAAGIGVGIREYDGVRVSGLEYIGDSGSMAQQISDLNGSKIVYARGDDYIVVVGLLDQSYTADAELAVSRSVPDMDFITEAENRLWGCKYGVVDGKTVNEIYCCALGDFRNWEQYLGVATDSWRGSVGSDGEWTGAVTHLGHPIFFKENVLHKVYISAQGAHQVMDTQCRGVQKGSDKSLVVVNEVLYYKSRVDVCAYDGSLPVSVSEKLGGGLFYDAVAGEYGDRYYISMRQGDRYTLWCYDTRLGMWHKEDSTPNKILDFVRIDDDLVFVDDIGVMIAINGTMGEAEPPVNWSATTGVIGYETVDQKYVSRFNLRVRVPRGSFADLYIQYDSDGKWIHSGHIQGIGTRTFTLPVRPRRCDHLQLKLTGRGEIKLFSMSKILELGGDMQ